MDVFRFDRRPQARAVRGLGSCVVIALVMAVLPAALCADAGRQAKAVPATSDKESVTVRRGPAVLPDDPPPSPQDNDAAEPCDDVEEPAGSPARLCTRAGTLASESEAAASSTSSLANADSRSPLRHPDYARMAQTDPVGLLRLAKASYEASVKDYTVTFIRQERGRDGHLQPAETMECKFRRTPFNVFLKWHQGAGRIDRALYAPTILGPEILVHPTGLAGLLAPVVRIDFQGKHADSARQIRDFGFAPALERLIQRGTFAQTRDELKTSFLGETNIAGRTSLGVQWRLPPGRTHEYGRIVVHLCRETLLPLTIALWDWDEQLQAKYVYKDLRLNVGLTDDDFSTASCGLGG